MTMERTSAGLLLIVLSILVTAASANRRRRPAACDTQQDSSFLWRVSDRDPPVHLFGTIHVPYTRVWDRVPASAKRAFERADSVFFELDLMDPETVAQLASCQMLPSGKRLSDVLPGELYTRLKRHLDYVRTQMRRWMSGEQKGRGLYPEYLFKAMAGDWEKKRPVWVMLMVNSLTEGDVRSRGVPVLDLYLAREAARMRKRSGAVEKVHEQCLPLNGLNVSQVLFALNQTLSQQESLRSGEGEVHSPSYTTEDLIRHYNCGDLDSLVIGQDTAQVPNLLNRSSLPAEDILLARNIDRYFRREIIDKRNERMAQRVLRLIRTHPDESFFFAFGAGHFLGEKSILEFLESGGFRVEQMAADAELKTHRRAHHHPRHREEPSLNELGRPWEEQRRRYRKRGNGHGSVHLLRTRSTPQPRKRQRHFNDLWVKMESQDRSLKTDEISEVETVSTRRDSRRNAKLWYQPNDSSAAALQTLSGHLLSWTLSFMFLLWTQR